MIKNEQLKFKHRQKKNDNNDDQKERDNRMAERMAETEIENPEYTIETLLYSDMQLEIEGVKFNVNLFFPRDNAETVSDKLMRIAEDKSKVS
ncbi:hypothetical protein SAMN02910317_01593 [Ruminococcaceae bacterium FB2012]|nr:hypothetical protein SAMN02910317_01593 [Ruminococcaceae bacterium FB2012]